MKRVLEDGGWKYEIDEDGDFRMEVDVGDGRTHLVWISSSTNEVMGLEVREVWSLVYVQEEDRPVPDNIAQWALQKSTEFNVGSLASTGNGAVYFALKIDADVPPTVLSDAVDGVAVIGDELEQKKSVGDEL